MNLLEPMEQVRYHLCHSLDGGMNLTTIAIAIRYIRTHPGAGDLEVDLIARTWELHPGAAPTRAPDCVIARCEVSR